MRTSNVTSAALLSLFAALPSIAGCGAGGGSDGPVDALGDAIKPSYGVDYAWARPSLSHLKSQGYAFAARYLSYDTSGKSITASEAHAIEKAGLDIVLVWEEGGTDALDGYQRGVQHAKAAAAQAKAAGMPSGRPIYFACDFDEQTSQQGAVNAYFEGVASVIGHARTGAYGGYGLIKRLFDDGKITWGWQTYAWSSGHWDPRAHLRQVLNGVENGSCDRDEAVAADFGQWGPSAPKPPPPPPPPPQGPPTASPAKPSGCGTIPSGHGLVDGEGFSSCDGRFTLSMQSDGNLVLDHNGVGPLWSTQTHGTDGFAAVMQSDGDFVVYGKHTNPLWSSVTDGHAGAHLAVQDDGNLVVYAANGAALWASNTVVPTSPPEPPAGSCAIMEPGHALAQGEKFSSCDGHHTLEMQTDGNLVLYHDGKGALWATGTNGKGHTAVMQGDGNFVLYDASNHPLWNSVTEGHAGAYLAVQNDGNMVVYSSGGAALWNTHTNGK